MRVNKELRAAGLPTMSTSKKTKKKGISYSKDRGLQMSKDSIEFLLHKMHEQGVEVIQK